MKNLRTQFQTLLRTFQNKASTRHRRRNAPAAVIGEMATESLENRAMLSAGALDTTFGIGGEQSVAFDLGSQNSDKCNAIAIQSNGKILLAGGVQRASGSDYDFGVTRLNSNGSLDTTFGTNGKVAILFDIGGSLRDVATGIAVQADGKIVVVGSSNTDASGHRTFSVARLTSSGVLDTSFDGDGKRTISFGAGDVAPSGVSIQSNGKIVVAGTRFFTNGDADMAVARLNSNGSLDTTFSGDGMQTVLFDLGGANTDQCNAVALQSDGKIVLAGSAQRSSSGDYDFAVARLTTSGNLDTTFDSDGKKTIAFDKGGSNYDAANAVAMAASGKIVLAGVASYSASDYDFAIARLNSNGSLDTTFSGDGRQTVPFDQQYGKYDGATAVKIQADGKIVVAGFAGGKIDGGHDYAVARLNSNGDLDTSFNGTGKRTSGRAADDQATAMAIQSNGRIVLAGFAIPNHNYDFGVVRLMNS